MPQPDRSIRPGPRTGLHPDRLVYCETGRDEDVLAACEEGPGFGGFGCIIGKLVRLHRFANEVLPRISLFRDASIVEDPLKENNRIQVFARQLIVY